MAMVARMKDFSLISNNFSSKHNGEGEQNGIAASLEYWRGWRECMGRQGCKDDQLFWFTQNTV